MNNISQYIKKILLHIFILLGISLVLGFLFLKIYLPIHTNHGETVSIPDLGGYSFVEGIKVLEQSGLQYEISVDSGFHIDKNPFEILKQVPPANTQVKTGRKVFLTLNAQNAPLLKMPNLVNTPLKNVQQILENMGLGRGEIIYVPDIGTNVVLEQRYLGTKISEGSEIPKGAKIDLMVGDGLGNQVLSVPDLLGMDPVEAEFLILGSGLRLGEKKFMDTNTAASGKVVLQSPAAGTDVNTGEIINIWISKINY